ncbi:hypothetical protein DC362_20255, partial [Acinetobacter nosocomialis]
ECLVGSEMCIRDSLEALELVDTSSAPDIEWPTPPAVQAR